MGIFFVCLLELAYEAIWPWTFVCKSVFYILNLISSDWSVQLIYFLIWFWQAVCLQKVVLLSRLPNLWCIIVYSISCGFLYFCSIQWGFSFFIYYCAYLSSFSPLFDESGQRFVDFFFFFFFTLSKNQLLVLLIFFSVFWISILLISSWSLWFPSFCWL